MSVLLAISILAFLALIWATFAIVMHIRQAKQPGLTGDLSHPQDAGGGSASPDLAE